MKNNKPHVFVVDDEPVIALTLATILRKSGFSADAFTNPLQALESAQTDSPDLLLSDVVMPHLSGIDLAIRIKAICPECKILLFSAQAATVSFLREAQSLDESIHILQKPIHPDDLLAAIRLQVSKTPVASVSQEVLQATD